MSCSVSDRTFGTNHGGRVLLCEAVIPDKADEPSAAALIDLEMLGLALEGAALVASANVDEGMSRLDEATTVALEKEAEVPISGAWACCFLVSACGTVRDYERASEWCDRIVGEYGEAGDGAVRVEITGEQKIKKIHIDPEYVDLDDIGQLESWVEDSVKDAIAQSQRVAAEKMQPMMGALGDLGL